MSDSQPDGEQLSPRVQALIGLFRPADQPRVVEDGDEVDEQAPVLVPGSFVRRRQPRVVIIVVEDEDTPPIVE